MTETVAEISLDPEHLAIMLALGLFLGMAFEEYFTRSAINPPGGVRTFPLLALTGALLYLLEPEYGLLFLGGLMILGTWLSIYYYQRLKGEAGSDTDARSRARSADEAPKYDGGIMAIVSNLLAFLLGPITLTAPLWVAVSVAVAAVLLTGARDKLHKFAASVEAHEIVTLGKFLIIIGVVLPLVPDTPITSFTDITPYQVWLAVVTVSTLSYASYLTQKFLTPRHGALLSGFFGGLYSSTATTVVLSRQLNGPKAASRTQAGITLATAIMFIRVLVVIAVFNMTLALTLLPVLSLLCVLGLGFSAMLIFPAKSDGKTTGDMPQPTNPLELSTALIFATLFIVLSITIGWARTQDFGTSGLYALAALAGVTDVDPFVLSIATHDAGNMSLSAAAPAILITTSANNMLKAVYTFIFAGREAGWKPALALAALSVAGLVMIPFLG